MTITDTAKSFFEACEMGKGWKGCAAYCTTDATFDAEAKALEEIHTMEAYADWMKDVCERIPDAGYEVKGFATDQERAVVLAYGVFSGTIGKDEDARPYATNYVYAMHFKDDKIAHMMKIWNDTYT